jgi:hypothetical protein
LNGYDDILIDEKVSLDGKIVSQINNFENIKKDKELNEFNEFELNEINEKDDEKQNLLH